MKLFGQNKEIARGFNVTVEADSVDSPMVIYGGAGIAILFTTEIEKYGRVTFEGLDALKVCRGENCPYENDWKKGSPYRWVSIVENSSWLCGSRIVNLSAN